MTVEALIAGLVLVACVVGGGFLLYWESRRDRAAAALDEEQDAALRSQVAVLEDKLLRERAVNAALRLDITKLEADLATCRDPDALRASLRRMLQEAANPTPAGTSTPLPR